MKRIIALTMLISLITVVPVRAESRYLGNYRCTAYCTEKRAHICGNGTGITASGAPVKAGISVAVNRDNLSELPFGSVIYIEDIGIRIVEDVGGGVDQNQIDVAVDTHKNAKCWEGMGEHAVYLLEVNYE